VPTPLTALVLTPSIGGFYFGELLSGVGREITAAGGRIVLVQTDGAPPPSIAQSHIDGVVSITTAAPAEYLQQLSDAGKPVVLVSARLPDFAAPTAVPDNRGGTVGAVGHLVGHGHRRIGFLGNLAQPDVRDRYDAYLHALEAHGIAAESKLLFRVYDNEWDGGVEAANALLECAEPPTALMVATDRNAIGLMRTLTAAGWSIPRDLAVVGFDNIEAAAFSRPTLTSVDQRFDEVGALAGRLLLAQLRSEEVAFAPYVLPSAQLARRESCGCDAASLLVGTAELSLDEQDHELEDALRRAVRTGDSALDKDAGEAVRATLEAVEVVLAGDRPVTAEQTAGVTGSLRSLTNRPDMLRRITSDVIRYLRVAGARVEPLVTALWQLQAGALHRQTELTEAALEEQFRVDTALLGAGASDPCRLDWLAGTHVRTGVLALWEESSPAGRLHITGAYDATGALPDLVGAAATPEEFPPKALIDMARIADRRACIVVPVASKGRDWGLLAVIGEVRPTSTLEPYRHWASQLSAFLEQQTLQEAVRANEERYALASQATNDGLWEWNVRNGDVFMSERCCALLGIEPQPETDRFSAWENRVHPDDLDEMRHCLRAVAAGGAQTGTTHYRVRSVGGDYRWVLCKAIGVASPGGPVARVVGSMSDIHEQRLLEDQLRENALHDALTGLPNRRLFLERLDHAIELWRRSRTPYAVIFLDLDRFKSVNDRLGHQAGDHVLSTVARRMQAELRAIDIGARFGGDEFAVLLHDVGHAEVPDITRRLQSRLSEPIDFEGRSFVVGASLGVATSELGYADSEDVLRDADTAMYDAKGRGRATISVFDEAMGRQRPGEFGGRR
jgi:diguanylate cyclase (GGDEF)-like protein/PAS domain S-box-containing protein